MKNSFIIHIIESQYFSTSSNAFSFEISKKLGEKKDSKIYYSNFEAYYLVDRFKAIILKNNKELTKDEFLNFLFKNDRNFFIKYSVFKRLRERGFIVKTALKFGNDFRVYEKNSKHAKWVCIVFKQDTKLDLKEFIAKNRISHSTAKKLLIGIVDAENDISFYESDWVKI